jgi:hypothetical protein
MIDATSLIYNDIVPALTLFYHALSSTVIAGAGSGDRENYEAEPG